MEVVEMSALMASIIARFNREHGHSDGSDCHFVARLRADGLGDWQIACVIHAVENTCKTCWDAPAQCRCDPAFDE